MSKPTRDDQAQEHRRLSAEQWEDAAPGWERRQAGMRDFGAPVSHWMVDAVDPQPGQRVLELAAGLGETGFLAAELVAPMGGAIISDQADAMLAGARRRAGELGLTNVEFQVLNAEWIDLPVASVDAVLCRWGYMLMVDPQAAVREARRVLRPGGRIALAVWDALEHNPWAHAPALELRARGLSEPPPAGTPGPFTMTDTGQLTELLAQAGFAEIELDVLDLRQRHASFADYWEATLDLSRSIHDAVLDRPEPEIAEIRAAIAERLQPYRAANGALSIPGRTLVAAASA
ncbi:MAG TPA: methyltransferase domain-containing protein [Solirubrobacteraceae bacterium]|nr:methyltransferase domain-containing protein [Solirubrobacteraceae bacterium]